MFHRIRADLARTLVPLILLPLACVLRAPGIVTKRASAPRPPTFVQPQHPSPIALVPRTRPYLLDNERRIHRTAMRLALDGFVVQSDSCHALTKVVA
ncbi:hypothetical protein [Streptomyces sp. ADI93-02]|uniref:hypothetical protein n=1 Tax=unclassified Streptomyces TaxID=2593676 RepID=UPI000F55546C|nr:hypothetical protein [Streptomyces sp. ADI93-02]RPK40081.1 hypothetical protein EES40_23430 [Streptomyces sp. ADI93-02]WSS76806.1 hypothetical protein OG414_16890 [Streptomyces sp. NBC_01174]